MSVSPKEVEEGTEQREEPGDMDTTPQGSVKSLGSKKRHGRWKRLKKRWNRKGVVEVDVDHHRYELLGAIQEAIRDLVANHAELGPKEELEADDYTHVLVKNIRTSSGKSFEFHSYASAVFATLRHAVGLSEEEYMTSLAPPAAENKPYLEFISNSKGGQDFYLTNDKAYFLKTEKKYYVDVFLEMLGEYLNHFLNYPHSLLVKFLGLYSVKISSESMLYFYVMQSIFYPEERIEIRYDVKGCLAGRFQQPRPAGSPVLTILKDQNFVNNNETLNLGGQRDWFLEQLHYDVEFLQSLGVQDYSLLIGRHPLHPDEKRQDFGDFVNRVKKSLGNTRSKSSDSFAKIPKRQGSQSQEEIELQPIKNGDVSEAQEGAAENATETHDQNENTADSDQIETQGDPDTSQNETKKTVRIAEEIHEEKGAGGVVKRQQTVRRPLLGKAPLSLIDQAILDASEVQVQNRRLLPDTKNPLHVIEGPEFRYYLGIIDFLTLYECRQRMGRMLKNVRFCCADHSTVHPTTYGNRFLDFIEEHTA